RTAARPSVRRSRQPARAGWCWWRARGTSGSRSWATNACRSPTWRRSARYWRSALARLSVLEAANAMNGRVTAGDLGGVIDGAAIDSRAVRGGEVFFAFPGTQVDGHRFVPDALARGAAAAVVQEDIQEDVPAPPSGALIRVDDTFQALHDLARFVRTRVPEKLVGITGSAGKTT